MQAFAFSGRTRGGETINGQREAESLEAAVASLRREQILITRIDPVKAKASRGAIPKPGGSVPAKSLAIFTRQFSVMIDAGLPLVQCLDILGRQEPHKRFAATILKTREDVESGMSLADAMRKHPRTFDECDLGRHCEHVRRDVAEPVGHWLEHAERLDVCLVLRGVGTALRERYLYVDARRPGRLLDGGIATEHDQIGERHLLA